jgi:transmembrane sensor
VSNETRESAGVKQMDEAMEWVQRLSDESSTEADVSEWLTWYESDTRNRQLFDEFQRFWIDTKALCAGSDGRARLTALERDVRSAPRVADAPGTSWRASHRKLAGVARYMPRIAAVVILSTVVLRLASPPVDERPVASRDLALSPSVRHAQLPDGSVVDLAAHASIAVRFTEHQRTLMLNSGEAFFSVAPNHARPFVVNTPVVRIRAVGTQFNVREEKDRVVVSVIEGVVDVSARSDRSDETTGEPAHGGSGALRINAGNEVIWLSAQDQRVVRAADRVRVAGWREGRLDYVNENLATVVAEVSKYSNRQLVIRDPQVARMTYTGTVLLSSVDEWLRAMPSEFPIKVVQENDQSVIEYSKRRDVVQ